MKLPREVYGRDLARARWAYLQVNQAGSHINLQTETPRHHRISVPDHKPLRIGTLNAPYARWPPRKASRARIFLPR